MILLLTGCINPDGMAYTALSNKEERKRQYINAIKFYLTNTNYPIVFAENSGTDIGHLFTDDLKSSRLETLTFSGNKEKYRGKGYGECEIIQYALDHSSIICSNKNERIAKITGRLIISNIRTIVCLHQILSSKRTTLCAINSELSFPDSRIVIASKDFFRLFLKSKDKINDTQGYYFEHALCDSIKEEKQYPFSPFFIPPHIEGTSGSTGKDYCSENKKGIKYFYKYFKYALSQRRQFYKLYRRNNRYSL